MSFERVTAAAIIGAGLTGTWPRSTGTGTGIAKSIVAAEPTRVAAGEPARVATAEPAQVAAVSALVAVVESAQVAAVEPASGGGRLWAIGRHIRPDRLTLRRLAACGERRRACGERRRPAEGDARPAEWRSGS